MKAGAISLAIAAVLAIFLSWWLELSPKGIAAITTLSIVVCVAIGQLCFAPFGVRSLKMKTKGILILSALLSLFGCTSGVDQWMTTTTTAPRGPLLNMDNPSEAGPEILARIAMRGYLDTSKPVPRGYGA